MEQGGKMRSRYKLADQVNGIGNIRTVRLDSQPTRDTKWDHQGEGHQRQRTWHGTQLEYQQPCHQSGGHAEESHEHIYIAREDNLWENKQLPRQERSGDGQNLSTQIHEKVVVSPHKWQESQSRLVI